MDEERLARSMSARLYLADDRMMPLMKLPPTNPLEIPADWNSFNRA